MSGENSRASKYALFYSAAVLATAALFVWLGYVPRITEAAVNVEGEAEPLTVFPANPGTLGLIPDGPGTPSLCGSFGTAKDVTFSTSGLNGTPSSVSVDMTFGGPIHTYSGDLWVTLIAPSGESVDIFKQRGSGSPTGCGSSADLAGPYTFIDNGLTTWNTVVGNLVPSGSYRNDIFNGSTHSVGNITPAFAGATLNGTWTLRFRDGGGGDTGAVSAANLNITGGAAAPTQHVFDYDGDGKTDYPVVRNVGGGASGQVGWFIANSSNGSSTGSAWGIASDRFIGGDYDGDGKTDIAVWRSVSVGQPTGNAFFYILRSSDGTVKIEDFGQASDNPTVVGDYDGDGKDDVAVYRGGVTPGAPSFWYFRGSMNNPSGNITGVQWGQNGDFPAPGDYDGDGKADYATQRNNGGGTAVFWMLKSGGGTSATVFGTPTDVIVPGDYDGDGKTDIAVIRGASGSFVWWWLKSSDGGVEVRTWGSSATDGVTQGDYDGDGKTDAAVWRQSATPGASAFWVLKSSDSGLIGVPWGANGDYPVANSNSH